MRLEISVLSKAGGRPTNEDACGYWAHEGVCFCVVCDGAGGQGGGDVASKLAVGATLSWFQATPECSAAAVASALAAANDAVMREQHSEARLATMRATAVVLAVDATAHHAVWAHLGDSRLYCFRDGRVIAQTKDHSVVQNMVDAGYLEASDLRTAQERSCLFAALGQEENFEPSPGPNGFKVAAGDAFLLCTDGFWEYIDEQEMAGALEDTSSGEAWLRRMERIVLGRGDEGRDNYSALAVCCSSANAGA
jgi:serine/threonine protein phosphatase PrpC